MDPTLTFGIESTIGIDLRLELLDIVYAPTMPAPSDSFLEPAAQQLMLTISEFLHLPFRCQ